MRTLLTIVSLIAITFSQDINVTFSVDMSAENTHPEGVYLAGGGFGQEGYLMTDDGNDVWSVTVSVTANTMHYYKFRNQPSFGTWDGFENPNGLIAGGCAAGDYNDRYLEAGSDDIVLATVAYGSCTSSPISPIALLMLHLI